ncbi:hypothetical protein IV203_026702 [Nitzschia inconspicua]|uniref:Uncharacterized protein n=1 Tax=Nitzschia inconspicua TaxID=303405 RepID=A0A9K3PXE5_9STRA|nr:hypothetical protein IV203_026702 [Nitzschia inconspicua]
MSRSSSPSQRYCEILANVLSVGSKSDTTETENGRNNIEESLSALYCTRRHKFRSIEQTDSVGEEAKRLFREKRRFKTPFRSNSLSSASERRQDLSLDSVSGGMDDKNAVSNWRSSSLVRRRPLPDESTIGHKHQYKSSPNIRNKRILERRLSMSPSRTTQNIVSTSSNDDHKKPLCQELRDDESIQRFSISPARTRAHEIVTTRSIQSLQNSGGGHKNTISLSPSNEGNDQSYTRGREDLDRNIPRSPTFQIQKDREITSLRREVEDLQAHRIHVVESQEVLRQRMVKKEQALESTVIELEETKKTVQVQTDHISFVESCLKDREEEIAELRQELEDSKRTCSKLELEVEVHDLKFSIYDDYRRLMDKQRLDRKIGGDEDESYDIERAKLNHQEQDYLSIVSKLEHLETMYKDGISHSLDEHAKLQEEHEKTLEEISVLEVNSKPSETTIAYENDHESTSKSMSSTSVTVPQSDPRKKSFAQNTIELLEKRIKILESDRRKSSLQLHTLQQEIARSRSMQNNLTVFTNENELTILRLEKDALRKRISALETEIGFTSGQIDDKTRTRRYRALEKNLNDYIVEIMSLEDKLRAKDSVIAALKSKNLERRLLSDDKTVISASSLVHSLEPSLSSNTDQKQTSDPRSRRHQKLEELKSKSKKFATNNREGTSSSTSSSDSRIAHIRQRLQELSMRSTDGNSSHRTSSTTDEKDFDGLEI